MQHDHHHMHAYHRHLILQFYCYIIITYFLNLKEEGFMYVAKYTDVRRTEKLGDTYNLRTITHQDIF